jgi:hypothetical protein
MANCKTCRHSEQINVCNTLQLLCFKYGEYENVVDTIEGEHELPCYEREAGSDDEPARTEW